LSDDKLHEAYARNKFLSVFIGDASVILLTTAVYYFSAININKTTIPHGS